jgi:hypothetical protein
MLTLISCFPFNYIGAAPERFIVRAERTSMATKRTKTISHKEEGPAEAGPSIRPAKAGHYMHART